MDNLFEQQLISISKAGAYDAIKDDYAAVKKEVEQLRYEKSELAIKLKGAQDMIKALKDFINEVRPENSYTMQLGEVDKEIEDELSRKNQDDIKDVL